MNQDIVIKVDHISKSFRIPQEQRNTIKEHVTGFRKKMVYENFHALKNLSFEVRRGEFFSIIGRNGSGKSTLLKILAGIYSADSGSIIVNDEISPFLELGVGFNPELSGKDNIYLNATILGLSKFDIDRNYHKIVNFSELHRFMHLKVKNYSSGMQVRLAFSVAIHAEKEILLMDEVLAVGDVNFQVKCFNVFEEFIKQGKTIIFVSHDPASVQKYSDRVLYLESGRAGYIGNANEALSRYMYTDVIKEAKDDSVSASETPTNQSNIGEAQSDKIQGDSSQVTDREDAVEDVEKIVEIVSVQVLNDEGKITGEIIHGQIFQIRVQYRLLKDLSNLIFGIIIYDQKKRAMFTTNTFSEKVKTGKIEPGTVTMNYRITNYLSAGNYLLSATVSDKTQRIYYDWKDGIQSFKVSNNLRLMSYGGADLPHEIVMKKD
ncbi:MAG: ABC transporter ATP-binding protein [Bacteroidetes bacterium]|nr:ABC transporter ATP-binding protein [Bacteroidota bacterium]